MLYLVGLDDALAFAKNLGITGLRDKSQYGLSLVLGGGEVSLVDMATAYGVFATGGIKNNTTGILSVKDHSGTTVEQFEANPTQVLDKNIALQISDILSGTSYSLPEQQQKQERLMTTRMPGLWALAQMLLLEYGQEITTTNQ